MKESKVLEISRMASAAVELEYAEVRRVIEAGETIRLTPTFVDYHRRREPLVGLNFDYHGGKIQEVVVDQDGVHPTGGFEYYSDEVEGKRPLDPETHLTLLRGAIKLINTPVTRGECVDSVSLELYFSAGDIIH